MRSLALVFLGLLLLCAPAVAAPKEEKIFIYFVYDKSNAEQARFIDVLYEKFKTRGFRDFVKKAGIAWVEGNYSTVAGVLNYLDISRDDLVYFAVVTADKNDRLIREIAREKVPVHKGMNDRDLQALAERFSPVFYYATENALEEFHNAARWRRQMALVDPQSEKAGGVTISLNGKDLTKSFPVAPFKRAVISTVMVPYSVDVFKRLGIEASESPWRDGMLVRLKHGQMRLDFYAGSEIQDRKIFRVDTKAGERTFIPPTSPSFSYPENHGRMVFLPLRLIVKELAPGLTYQEEGDKVSLTKK